MMRTVGLLQLALLAFVSLTAFSSLTSGVLYLALRNRLAHLAPAPRATALLLCITSPALLGLSFTALCFLPSLLALLRGGVGDHCVTHPDHHVHLCLLHLPHDAGNTLGWLLLGAALCLGTVALARHTSLLQRARRSLSQLHSGAVSGRAGVTWIHSQMPIALTLGGLRPRTIVSDALRDGLAPSLLEAVLAHEAAHQRRRDVLRKWIAAAFVLLHVPRIGKRLLDDLNLACEQAADAEAAERVGSLLVVADAILATERLAARFPFAAFATASSFGDSCVVARVEALLDPTPPVPALKLRWLMAAALTLGFVLAEHIHHGVETLLTPLAQ